MMHGRYFKVNGTWKRETLAFMTFHAWELRNPHVEHGARSSSRREKLGPRNYSCWPVFESAS